MKTQLPGALLLVGLMGGCKSNSPAPSPSPSLINTWSYDSSTTQFLDKSTGAVTSTTTTTYTGRQVEFKTNGTYIYTETGKAPVTMTYSYVGTTLTFNPGTPSEQAYTVTSLTNSEMVASYTTTNPVVTNPSTITIRYSR